uniref:Uncharacterized protein n=1 Tax=Xiphophorus maculatus TaxID=8083 RepID=M3ZEQ7_XIPMA
MNWGPRSERISRGMPWSRNTCLTRSCAVWKAVGNLRRGTKWQALEKRSTMERMVVMPLEGGKPVTKSMVAVIIPFRNRYEHLTHWLHYLHPVLMRQQLDYGVYVINQDGDGVFNRAKLMNIGFVEALKEYDYDCFVFSDVDLVPIDDRNLYRCSDHPRHLSVAVDKFNFILPYATIFGGVSALSEQQFLKVNGFSNTFWGWGGEDDDMSQRISYRGMFISRPDSVTGRYKMIQHERDSHNDPNPRRVQKLRETYFNIIKDGLSTLSYTVREIRKDLLYTFVTVDVQVPAG